LEEVIIFFYKEYRQIEIAKLCRIPRVISLFGRNDKLDGNILMEMIALAPIEVEILLFFFFKKIKD